MLHRQSIFSVIIMQIYKLFIKTTHLPSKYFRIIYFCVIDTLIAFIVKERSDCDNLPLFSLKKYMEDSHAHFIRSERLCLQHKSGYRLNIFLLDFHPKNYIFVVD